ncbi:hypothetical protein [Haloglomus litoreum]|uniref:hypothetical protein n=1 Tax=Haloglomus litoreum TaxID=3034026 RepID=UPI0023E8867D|nr:hypothetical protein [Haloglomus sp. DT116]
MSDQCATCGAADVILFTCGYCDRVFCTDHTLPHHSCEGLAHPGEGADEVTFEWRTAGHTGGEDPFTGSGFRAADGRAPASEPPTPRSPSGPATPAVEPAPRRTGADHTRATARVPRDPDGDPTPAVSRASRTLPDEPAAAAVERVPRTVEGAATAAVRPAPRRPSGLVVRAVRPAPDAGTPGDASSAATGGLSTGASADGGAVSTAASPAAEPTPSPPVRTMDTKRSPGSTARNEPRTLREWLDQQTYVSLSVKTAALATIINGALYLGMTLTLHGLLPI